MERERLELLLANSNRKETMTVEDAYDRLQKLIDDGYGDLRVGFFCSRTGDFISCDDFIVSKNGGYYEPPDRPKKTEQVVHLVPEYIPIYL